MNGLGLRYWANDSGRNVMPGLEVLTRLFNVQRLPTIREA